MKIIDKYILKRYLVTFSVMLIMFIPIGITIDVSEKVNKMIEKKIPLKDILIYYGDFTIYFANLLFPIFLFLSIIWFTSKLANNTEIMAGFTGIPGAPSGKVQFQVFKSSGNWICPKDAQLFIVDVLS